MNGLLRDLLDASGGHTNGNAEQAAPTPARALAWARVSTDMQDERGLSIPEQFREIRLYAAKHDISIDEEFHEAVSAFHNQQRRIEFQKMLARARSDRGVSIILVHDFSRFCRDSAEARFLIQDLRKAGVRVVSLNDPEFDSETVAGVYMEAITHAKNEAYSREVAFHTRKGCRANVQTRDLETGWCYKNGGQPLWGYRGVRLLRGEERGGRPIFKSIWGLDEATVAGRAMHELVRYWLVTLAGGGASLAELRDFCNQNGIPGRRNPFWGLSTVNAILQPSVLLQYCGFGVWNVHRKSGQERSPEEWVVVENAHPALLTEDEARAIAAARQRNSQTKKFDTGFGQSRNSTYLLSGGLFKCSRCGANMTGFRTESGYYYVCGSQPYRKGMGCGPGVYVPQAQVEAEVISGLKGLVDVCVDPKRFTRKVNEELRRMWEASAAVDPHADQKIQAIDTKIGNIRRAVEEGLEDANWANVRLRELHAERKALAAAVTAVGQPPRIDAEAVLRYGRQTEKLFSQGEPAERKRLLRTWVREITLVPEELEVKINYRVPESVMNGMVAGVGFEPTTFGL